MKVLLYSGGLDSELYRYLESPDLLLHFPSNVAYTDREQEQLERLQKLPGFQKLVIDRCFSFSDMEMDNAIVPMRNLYYLLRAFEYGDEVFIGVTHYDLHYDKQEDTLSALELLVRTYFYKRKEPASWPENARPVVQTPYREYSKGELLKDILEETPGLAEHFRTLRTCYHPTSQIGCGRCKSCIQKAMALAVAGIFSPHLFDEDPRKTYAEWASFYLKEAKEDIDVSLFNRELEALVNYP